MKTTVKEFLGMNVDIDICDDVCEELYIGFVGPVNLTAKGKEKFALILNDEVEMRENWGCASYNIGDLPDGVWEKHLELAKELFSEVAGYQISEAMYDKLFEEPKDASHFNYYGAFVIAMELDAYGCLKHDELDLEWDRCNSIYQEFLKSEYNVNTKSEFDCIQEFIRDYKEK